MSTLKQPKFHALRVDEPSLIPNLQHAKQGERELQAPLCCIWSSAAFGVFWFSNEPEEDDAHDMQALARAY